MNVLKDHVLKRDGKLGPEAIVWKREHSKGIFRKQTTSIDILTNYRVIVYNAVVEYVAAQLALEDLDDCIVINKNIQSNSNFSIVMSGNRAFRYGYGQTRSKGQTVGDLVFFQNGKPIIIFNQIADATGVLRLVKSVQKQLTNSLDR